MEPSDDQKLADEWAAALGEDPSAPSIDVDEVLAAPLEELKDTSRPITDDDVVNSIPSWTFPLPSRWKWDVRKSAFVTYYN